MYVEQVYRAIVCISKERDFLRITQIFTYDVKLN